MIEILAMRKACIHVPDFFVADRIFDDSHPIINRDDQLRPYRALRDLFRERGFEMRTQDLHSPRESEFTLYMEMPKILPLEPRLAYLLLLEPHMIRPDNYVEHDHAYFRKVFTWSDELVEMGRNYVKFNVPQVPPVNRTVPFSERKELAVMIAGAKLSDHPKEMYSERIKWIRWFEKHHPDDFHLFGHRWDEMWIEGPDWVIADGCFHSYHGSCEKKYTTLAKHKFSICLENQINTPGYVTEKIFDCLFSGNIPLYLGEPKIEHKIPKDCFIDLREFYSKAAAYERISTMSESEFSGYQDRIAAFLKSEAYAPFSIETFNRTIVETILGSPATANVQNVNSAEDPQPLVTENIGS